MLREAPVVYAVEQEYQIVLRVNEPCLCSVLVGKREFYDVNNGVLRSDSLVHRVTVPMVLLDSEKEYTVCLRPVTDRKPYFTETGELREYPFAFRPVPPVGARAFHVSDVHERTEYAVEAAKAFGFMDFLILNGDLANHNGNEQQADMLFTITSAVTGGEFPVVFARGNHDTRGAYAERFTDCIPLYNGRTYYTFRLGGIWGVVLDCGEDKPDSHAEYGYTVQFRAFREEETRFLETVAEEKAYEADGVHTRLVIVHNPFTHQLREPFNIEAECYRHWASILADRIRPDLMLCGHLHTLGVHGRGTAFDHLGQPCTLVVGGEPRGDGYIGVGFEFGVDRIRMGRADSNGTVAAMVEIVDKGGSACV